MALGMREHRKVLLIIPVLLICTIFIIQDGTASESSRTISVVMYNNYPPYTFLDSNGITPRR